MLPEASAFSLDLPGSKKKSSEGSVKSTTTTGTSQTDAKKNQDGDKAAEKDKKKSESDKGMMPGMFNPKKKEK